MYGNILAFVKLHWTARGLGLWMNFEDHDWTSCSTIVPHCTERLANVWQNRNSWGKLCHHPYSLCYLKLRMRVRGRRVPLTPISLPVMSKHVWASLGAHCLKLRIIHLFGVHYVNCDWLYRRKSKLPLGITVMFVLIFFILFYSFLPQRTDVGLVGDRYGPIRTNSVRYNPIWPNNTIL